MGSAGSLKTCAAVLVAALGLTVGAGSLVVPDGLHRGRPVELWTAAFTRTLPWGPPLASAAVLGLALTIALVGRHERERLRRRLTVALPLLAGLSLPLVAPLLDAFWIHGTAPVLAAAGAGLGLLATLQRAGGSARDGRRLEPGWARATLAGLAVLLPLLMTAPGEPWWHGLSGDEPHYAVIAHSVATDGDVEVGNQYREAVYRDWYEAELVPHAKPGADPSSRYSIHGVGLGVWLAPWVRLAAGIGLGPGSTTLLLRLAMLLWLGALAWVLHDLIRDVAGPGPALWGTAVAVFTAPLLFAGPHLFTEVPAATLSGGAYLLLRRSRAVGRSSAAAGFLAAGTLLALLPWLHFKYAGLAAVVAGAGVVFALAGAARKQRRGVPAGRGPRERPPPRRAAIHGGSGRVETRPGWPAVGALLAPLALSAAAHVGYTWALYGRLSPLALYVGAGEAGRSTAFGDDVGAYIADLPGAALTAVSYLMDQKDGLLFHAPHYLLAAAGLGWMWRRRRGDAVVLALALAALWGPYALSQEVGFWSPPVRPLTGALWTLVVPLGIALGRPELQRRLAWVTGALLAAGAGMTLLHVFQSDLLYHDSGVARSLLLQRYGAPGLPLWRAFPVWVEYGEQSQWLVSAGWLVAAATAAFWLGRRGWRAADTGGDHGALGDAGRDERGAAAGRRGATAAVWAAGALALLVHHLLVPISGLHRSHPVGGPGGREVDIRVWEPVSPPQRAWPEEELPDGFWVGGDDVTELWLSVARPLQELVLSVFALGPVRYRVQVGSGRYTGAAPGGVRNELRVRPGPGRRWDGRWFYRLRVACDGGVTPAELGLNDDGRNLGLRLGVVRVRTPRGRGDTLPGSEGKTGG